MLDTLKPHFFRHLKHNKYTTLQFLGISPLLTIIPSLKRRLAVAQFPSGRVHTHTLSSRRVRCRASSPRRVPTYQQREAPQQRLERPSQREEVVADPTPRRNDEKPGQNVSQTETDRARKVAISGVVHRVYR